MANVGLVYLDCLRVTEVDTLQSVPYLLYWRHHGSRERGKKYFEADTRRSIGNEPPLVPPASFAVLAKVLCTCATPPRAADWLCGCFSERLPPVSHVSGAVSTSAINKGWCHLVRFTPCCRHKLLLLHATARPAGQLKHKVHLNLFS
jgi:hypothetical protein